MATKMKDVTVTIATIDFGNWKISATGILDQTYDWQIDVDYGSPLGRDWKHREDFRDQEELEEFLWAEVQRLNQKYSVCVFEEVIEQVEDEDYEEDED